MSQASPINYGLKFGLLAGFATIIIQLILYIIDPNMLFSGIAFIPSILLLVLVIYAPIAAKRANGGYIDFFPAFLASLLTYVVSVIITSLFTYVLYNFVDPSLNQLVIDQSIDTTVGFMEAIGASEEQIEEAIDDIQNTEGSVMSLGNVLFGIVSGSFVASIFCAIIALIVKKTRKSRY